MLTTLGQCKHFVLAFDESLNKITQSGQMDVHIRYWDEVSERVMTRYVGSQFLGHATAIDLVDAFKSEVEQLNCKRPAQVSMDEPSVNWSFLDKMKLSLGRDPDDPVILDIGSCGLPIVHGAFRTGEKAVSYYVV